MNEDEALYSPLSHTDPVSSGGGTSSDLSSSTERLTMTEPTPFVVTEELSKRYYKGLPSKPPLIATTNPSPFESPSGPEAYSVLKELRDLGDHPLASLWDSGLAIGLRRGLNTMCVNWTSIEALRIVKVGESSGVATVWIGVEFGALSFKEGSVVAHECRTYIDSWGIHDYQVEIRESRVMRQAGNRFLDPVPFFDPTFTARNPYTATLGIPISAKDRPWIEGTGGFYLSAGGNDKDIYLVTARHVVLPLDKDDNKEYEQRNDNKAREDNLQKAKEALKALETLRHDIVTHWEAKEKRVFRELVWAPPIVLSTDPGMYTLDLAVIKIDPGKLDARNYLGNAIGIGNKYTRQEFMNKVYLHPTSPTSFKFPFDRLVKLQGQVPESALFKLPMLDAAGKSCLIVFKNGPKTDTTFGKANNVSSYTRTYFAGQYMESREFPVIPTNKDLGAFSAKGDSGSCVADVFNRIGGIITSGSGATDSSDVTYVTPISFIMKVLHDNKRFQNAHLNPVLAQESSQNSFNTNLPKLSFWGRQQE